MSEALNALARRPLTEAELRERLLKREWGESAIESVVMRLREEGYIDDARLALDYVVLRSARLAIGPLKLIAALRNRGVSEEVARAAWRAAVEAGDVDPRGALRRRIERQAGSVDAPLDSKAYARVYNAALRAGFESGDVRRELGQRRGSDPVHESQDSSCSTASEASHDVP